MVAVDRRSQGLVWRAPNVHQAAAIMGNPGSLADSWRDQIGAGQQNAHPAFPQVGDAQSPARGLVARGGVEPPTFRFSVTHISAGQRPPFTGRAIQRAISCAW